MANDSQANPEARFAALLARFPPEIVALVKRCLPKLRRAFPGCHELVYDYSHSLVVAFGMSDRGYEAIIAVAIFPGSVKLYFDKSLPDPKGLLQGSGTKVRSVVLKAASELDRGDIKALIDAAIEHSGASLPRAGATRMIIRPEAKKKPGNRKNDPQERGTRMNTQRQGKLVDGARCKVVGGTHAGKSGTATDIKTSKTGHVTITVVQGNGVRFKTLAKNVVAEGKA